MTTSTTSPSIQLLNIAALITTHGKTQQQTQANFHTALTYVSGMVDSKPTTGLNQVSKDGSHLICHECGKHMRSLRRHLKYAHQMSTSEYRAKHGISPKETLVHPEYSATRSLWAKHYNLGVRGEE